jgi:hypothetical protein
VPAQLEAAKKEQGEAAEAVKNAQAGVDSLPGKITAKAKAPYYKALNDAKARLANAELAVSEAQEKMDNMSAEKTVDHEVTQEDLDNNPELAAQGVKVGETIGIPAGNETTAAEVAADVKAAAKKPVSKKK